MKKEFTLTYQGQYHFCFSFEPGASMMGGGSGSYPLSVSLHRKDLPELSWDWNRSLIRGQEVEFRLNYADTINIKGGFHLFHSIATDEDFLFLDVWFGSQFEEHYEGNVLELGVPPEPDPDPDPEPVIPDPEPIDPSPDNERILPAGYHTLFPFLHLRSWPELTAIQLQSFIEYTDNGSLPPAADLYANLLKLTTRAAMETEADLFINGGGAYTGLFIEDVTALPFPFSRYPEVYDMVVHRQSLELPESQPLTHFLSSTDYAKEINIVWQNILALAIINGYRADIADQLVKILIIDHLFQTLVASPPPPQKDWEHLIHASVVLPGTLFPLPVDTPVTPISPPHFTGQVIPYAIGHLQKVQHCHTGYALGEIAQVENVSIGEVKQVKHRQTLITEEKTEHRTEQQDQHDRENTANQLEREALRALNQSIKDEWDFTNLSTSYGPPTTGTYNGKVTRTRDLQGDNNNANRFARKILATAVDRVAKAISHHRQLTVRQETEDTVIRTIDNRRGTRNLRSVYRWLNKLYQLRLVDYGQRFILELLIHHPEPPQPLPPTRRITALLTDTDLSPVRNLPVPEGYTPTAIVVTYNIPQPALLIAGTKSVSLSPASSTVTIDDPMNTGGVPTLIDTVPILLDLSPAPPTSPPALSTPFYCSLVMECTATPIKPHSHELGEKAEQIRVREACKFVLYQLHRGLSVNASPPEESIWRPEYLQFIDEAFEWREISFSLHDHNDKIRVLLPVNPNFNYRSLYYLSTGIPWYGSDRLTPVTQNQLPIAAALQQAAFTGRSNKYEILLDTWPVAVPTSMQWLQDDDRLPGLNS
jgi:hypothetical protein